MSDATVISQVESGSTFTAYINGTNDKLYDIYCNSTNICQIACESSDACSTLRLYCFGECFVSCDEENGIACPYSGVWDDWISSSPTYIPTTQPFNISSNSPSQKPTDIPSKKPSINPSNIPASMPSIEPTTKPSKEPSIYPSGKTTHEFTGSTNETDAGTTTEMIDNDDQSTPQNAQSILSQNIIIVVVFIIVFVVCSGVLCCGIPLVIIQRSKESKERL